ncbi:hypothetical protein PVAP13_5NG031700 [Panicum virgatum]|uniref:Uncharacterized protein n=1 Tax=Panicum virgatum TaxID=38727 RepID=A0A8T0RJQ0_PANVG|nr:hypothetical protein PVAP13_5NG031700 [Panicum virgatum]
MAGDSDDGRLRPAEVLEYEHIIQVCFDKKKVQPPARHTQAAAARPLLPLVPPRCLPPRVPFVPHLVGDRRASPLALPFALPRVGVSPPPPPDRHHSSTPHSLSPHPQPAALLFLAEAATGAPARASDTARTCSHSRRATTKVAVAASRRAGVSVPARGCMRKAPAAAARTR